MAPTRKSRKAGSTPAPELEDVISPPGKKTRVAGLVGNVAKHSESYGSPPTSRPMRSNLTGDGTVNQAMGKVFNQVRKDHQRIEEQRKAAAVEKVAKDAQTRKQKRLQDQMEIDEEEHSEPEDEANSDEDVDMVGGPAGATPAPRTRLRSASPRKQGPNRDPPNGESNHAQASRKRKQVSEEDDQPEQDRTERNARLQNERQQEASRITIQKRLEITQTLPGNAITPGPGGSMPPPSFPTPSIEFEATPLGRSPDARRGSFTGRSFIEESNIFANAEISTPAPSIADSEHRGSSMPPPVLPWISDLPSAPRPDRPVSNPNAIRRPSPKRLATLPEDELTDERATTDHRGPGRRPVSKEREIPESLERVPSRSERDRDREDHQPEQRATGREQRPSRSERGRREDDQPEQRAIAGERERGEMSSSVDTNFPELRQQGASRVAGVTGDRGDDRLPKAAAKPRVEPRPEPQPEPRNQQRPEPRDRQRPETQGTLDRLKSLLLEFTWGHGKKLHLGTILLASLLSLAALWSSLILPRLLSTNHPVHWYGWKDWDHNVGQFFLPGGSLDDPYGSLEEDLFSQKADLNRLGDKVEQNEVVVGKLNTILPKVVHVTRSATGKVVVAEDFWHALKDLINKDKTLVHMNDMLKEVEKLGGPEAKKRAIEEMQKVAKGTVSDAWERWKKDNEKLIDKKLSGARLPDNVLTREEFISELQKELKSRPSHDAEVDEIRQRVSELAKTTERLESSFETPNLQAAVDKAVREAIANARLKSAADDNIAAHLGELARRVNHFSLGNGASIDKHYTSPTFHPANLNPALRKIVNPSSVLQNSILEPGDCWCAGRNPADVAIHLKHRVIPSHIVLEHIDPETTVDPSSAPKDIEVWISIENPTAHELATDLMWARFPDTDKNHALLRKGFVKVGSFQYDWKDSTRGVLVHRLTELDTVGASTSHVIVRATTNMGAEHTCFYRMRFYGEPRELVAGKKGGGRWL